MRRLVLMRHAKTEPYNAYGDHARRLAPRGVGDAQAAGVALRGAGLGLALVSTATRTRETFTALGLGIPAEYSDHLYSGGTDAMLALIGEVSDDVDGLLIVGHAPTIPALAAELTHASDPAAADEAAAWYPTSAYASFTFDGTWRDLAEGGAEHLTTAGVVRPR